MPENSKPQISITRIRTGGACAHKEPPIAEDLQKVLFTDNTAEYNPVGDYNPATKKYVDDKLSQTNTENINDLIRTLTLFSHPYEIETTNDTSEINTEVTDENTNIILGNAVLRVVADQIPSQPTQADGLKLITLNAAVNYINEIIGESTGGIKEESISLSANDWTENNGTYTALIETENNYRISVDSVQDNSGYEIFIDRRSMSNGDAVLESDNPTQCKVFYHYSIPEAAQANP